MSNLGAIFDVLTSNSDDVEEIIRQFGGIGNVLKASKPLLRIMTTIAKHKEPVAAAERAANAIIYSDETRTKVEAFQKKHGLNVDGLVGDRTWRKVEELLK